MRVAEISTLYRPVPPKGEGSVERLVYSLCEALVAKGHEVTLFATADSKSSARLRSPVETSYSGNPNKWDWQLYEAYQVGEAFRAWRDFDVIHCHSYHFGLLYCDMVAIPSLHSFHIEPGPDYRFLAERTRNRHLLFCSRHQARDFGGVSNVHVIPHGIDLKGYGVAPREARKDYVVFLGRFTPGKGPLEAISIARRAGVPIKLAAPQNDYYRQVIAKEVDGREVEYVGEVRGEAKAELLSRARALLYPLCEAEAFGLVLVEALASGLPVVAYAKGAVPEIIKHGVSGWLGETQEELVRGVREVDLLSRAAIRKEAEARFSAGIMAGAVEELLCRIVEEAHEARGRVKAGNTHG